MRGTSAGVGGTSAFASLPGSPCGPAPTPCTASSPLGSPARPEVPEEEVAGTCWDLLGRVGAGRRGEVKVPTGRLRACAFRSGRLEGLGIPGAPGVQGPGVPGTPEFLGGGGGGPGASEGLRVLGISGAGELQDSGVLEGPGRSQGGVFASGSRRIRGTVVVARWRGLPRNGRPGFAFSAAYTDSGLVNTAKS